MSEQRGIQPRTAIIIVAATWFLFVPVPLAVAVMVWLMSEGG